MEISPEYQPDKNQLTLFEVRQFLGRTVLIVENVVYPQFTLEDNDDGTPEPLIG